VSLDLDRVQTNIVRYDVSGLQITASECTAGMCDFGIKAGAQEAGRVRMVTHKGIEKEDIEYTLEIAEKVTRQIREKR
jgi:threonine aldolase